MSNLIITGRITWRTDEISYKDFNLLNKNDKEEYLFLLKGLPEDERSTNDIAIMNMFIKEEKKKDKNFFSIKD